MNARENKSTSRVAVITGGSSGLGYAFAAALASKDYQLCLIARDEEKLKAAQTKLCESGYSHIHIYPADITHWEPMADAQVFLKTQFEPIDYLVINAGCVTTKLLDEYSNFKTLQQDIETDLLGSIITAKFFCPLVKPGGHVILVSSALGLFGVAGYSTYCAAKAGLLIFAESLRRELKTKGVHVHVACPGDIDTPQYQTEINGMPPWMKKGGASRLNPLAPYVAAQRILKKVKRNRFLVTTQWDVALLNFIYRFLPTGFRLFLIDRLFPMP